ncbi:MAG: DUF6285 domain-containing protein [Minwuia sp.]|uniref:DUF6285 domain-containing protein n=1 Tax=Minwuia sp. TaxID=2493630 RepID=UPI003A8B8C66
MQDRPTVEELLDAVEGFLRDVAVPKLEGQPAFHARVAANAVAIVRRELAQDEALADAETARLRDLLDVDGGRAGLNAKLAEALRGGMADGEGAVLAHLQQTAREKLAVANPKYREEA